MTLHADRFLPAAMHQAAAAAFAAVLASFAASAQSNHDGLGERMTSQDLRAYHSGQSRAGCYINRPEEPVWRERMAQDGRLYDLMKGGAEVGRWWIEEGGVVCFVYTDRLRGPHCFIGRKRGPYYDFYSAFDGSLVSTSECQDEPVA